MKTPLHFSTFATALILLSGFLLLGPNALAQTSRPLATPWVPFFEARHPRAEIIEQLLQVKTGRKRVAVDSFYGGDLNAQVVARIENGAEPRLYVERRFHDAREANLAYQHLKKLRELSEDGRLGHFRVVEPHMRAFSRLRTEYIDGVPLFMLAAAAPNDLRVRDLYARFEKELGLAMRPLMQAGYGLYVSDQACELGLMTGMTSKLPEHALIVYQDRRENPLNFEISTKNVLVDAATGEFVITQTQ